jgi:hypothetical protein
MFHTRLQQSAKNCGFTDKDSTVNKRMHFNRAQTKNFGETSNDIDAVLNKARAIEAAATQATKMEKESQQTALAMRHNKPTRDPSRRQNQDTQHETANQSKQPIDRRSCSFCGGQFHQRLASCPARYHQCDKCLNIQKF